MATRAFVASFDVDGNRTVETFDTYKAAREHLHQREVAWVATLSGPETATPCACPPAPPPPARGLSMASCFCGFVDGEIYNDGPDEYNANIHTTQNVRGDFKTTHVFLSVTPVDVPEGASADTVAAALPRDGFVIPLPAGLLEGVSAQMAGGGGALPPKGGEGGPAGGAGRHP